MRVGSLFSGAGGLDLAVQAVFGGEVVWHAEIDKAASKVLAYRFPGVPNLGDISAVDWADVPAVDVLCGGFPCQDVSAAGKRAGIKEGTRSGLWSVFAEAIDELRPQWVVIENVRGLLSATAHRDVESDEADMGVGGRVPVLRAAGAVLGDLADLGYDAQWAIVAASDVGAPHRRERVFILASATDADSQRRVSQEFARGMDEAQSRTNRDRSPLSTDAADSPRYGRHEGRPEPARIVGRPDAAVRCDESGVALLPTPGTMDDREKRTTHAGGNLTLQGAVVGVNPVDVERHAAAGRKVADDGVALLPTPAARDYKGSDTAGDHNRRSPGMDAVTYHFPALAAGQDLPGPLRAQGKADSTGKPPEPGPGSLPLLPTPASADGQRGQDFARANREGSGGDDLVTLAVKADRDSAWGKYEPAIRRWEQIVGPAPAPTEPNKNGNPRLSAAFSEWLMGWPPGWVTDPAISISRNDQLRIIGNGVCPQQAIAALSYLLAIATGTHTHTPERNDMTPTLLPTPTSRDHKGPNQRRDTTCLHGAINQADR